MANSTRWSYGLGCHMLGPCYTACLGTPRLQPHALNEATPKPVPCLCKMGEDNSPKPFCNKLQCPKCSHTPNTSDLTANPDAPPKILFIGHIGPAKSHLFWSIDLKKPDCRGKEFLRVVQCTLWHQVAPIPYKPAKNTA